MSIYKVRYGTPEEFVPTRFAPKPKCSITEGLPQGAPNIDCAFSRRGTKITFPIDPKAGVYGFGLQLKGFQQRGKKKTLRANADPLSDSGDSHAPVPFFVTTSGYGMFVDTARYAEFYCGKVKRGSSAKPSAEQAQNTGTASEVALSTDALYAVRESTADTVMTIEIPFAQGVDLYYITGDTILDIVSSYNMLSGGGCMPPLWGLGGFYRCCGQFDENQVLEMAERFRSLDIPCDILGLEPGWQSQTYSCSYLWDSTRFPHPAETVKRLSEMGFHVNLWEHAFTHPTSPLYESLQPYSGDYEVWGGLVPDFTIPHTRKLFSDYQKTLCDIGISGFKLDECDGSDFTGGWTFPNCAQFPSGIDGEQYHSMFGTMYCQTQLSALGNVRTLSEVRNLGALAASYPFVLYSDLYAHKDFIMGVVNSGFSGILWSPEVRHADSAEDLIRRVQTVVFSAQALVNAWYLPDMPWIAHGCTDEIRRLFRIRMQLLPYLYTMFYDYHTTGKPPVRALVCDYQNEAEAFNCADEYLFGDSMLVAPMTAGEHERDVWLPKGTNESDSNHETAWYNFFTGEKYECGMQHIKTEDIPVFVKEGTLLPLAAPLSHIASDTQFEITLRAYGDCSASVCRLIEDDGVSVDAPMKVHTVGIDGVMEDNFRYRIAEVEHIL
ncbi:MAG: glycoside hydrolase [Clostridia bacterium]|nr:glycoside hydrolase [Clostridia bacterium]